MTNKKLSERLSFEGDDVLLDENTIFSVPHRHTQSDINLLGVPEKGNVIFTGSGQCCFGYITILKNHKTIEGNHREYDIENPEFTLDGIRVPNFNVYDIMPVGPRGILATGYGCSGSGVQLIDTVNPKTIEIVSEEEFQAFRNEYYQDYNNFTPRFGINEQEGTISLDLLRTGFRAKPGRTRDPKLPSILVNTADEEFYISSDVVASKNLTPILEEKGFEIDTLIEANRGYEVVR
jgi:hypothetical protein